MPPSSAWLKESHVEAHARLMAARAAPDALADKDEFESADRAGPPARGFPRRPCSGLLRKPPSCARRHNKLAPRLRLQASVRAALCDARHQGGRRGGVRRREGHGRGRPAGTARGRAGGVGTRLRDSRARASLGAEFKVDDADARDRGADALRRLGAAFARGQEAPSRRAAVQGPAQARLRAPRADRDRGRRRRHAHAPAAAACCVIARASR